MDRNLLDRVSVAPGTDLAISRLRGGDHAEIHVRLGLRGFTKGKVLFLHGETFARAGDIWYGPGLALEAVHLVPWRPDLDEILQGRSSSDVWVESAPIEHIFNDTLVGVEEPRHARLAPRRDRRVLTLDVSIRLLKDKIDAATREAKQAVPDAGEAEQLLEQRKMLLGVVLGSMKSAAAQRATAP